MSTDASQPNEERLLLLDDVILGKRPTDESQDVRFEKIKQITDEQILTNIRALGIEDLRVLLYTHECSLELNGIANSRAKKNRATEAQEAVMKRAEWHRKVIATAREQIFNLTGEMPASNFAEEE